ncbi:MAG: ABC transporter ATP-binding protein [Ilumatobacteraceae bacterium]
MLEVAGLTVAFPGDRGWNPVVQDVSFEVSAGGTLGIVGESGSGKTVTALSLLGLTTSMGAKIMSGSVVLDGQELVGMSERRLNRIRGNAAGVIFQQPIRSLDPAFTVGDQIAEVVRRHRGASRREAWDRAVEMLDRVHIPEPARRAKAYPHQLSGGMCQRVMISIALACEPQLLIADEPTTALDVTVQSRILSLLRELQDELGIAIIFVSHDLGVIADVCQTVAVMYAGEIVERGTIEDIFAHPTHPYTEGLLGAIPNPGQGRLLRSIPGNVPHPGHMPTGCHFHPRCPYAVEGRCDTEHPQLDPVGTQRARCVRAAELSLTGVVAPC